MTEFGNAFIIDANFGSVAIICSIMEGILDLYSVSLFYLKLVNTNLLSRFFRSVSMGCQTHNYVKGGTFLHSEA
jgi:hypothetical protein